MELAETIPNLSGPEKKALVLDVLARLIDELPMQDDDKALLKTLILTVIPSTIDVIVSSSLGQFALNLYEQAEEEVAGCFAKCTKKKQAAAAETAPRQRRLRRVLVRK